MADTMDTAATAADGLEVSSSELSWVSIETGLIDTYAQIRAKVARLLREGASNFESVATALTRAADAYEGAELENADEIMKAWQLRDR